MEEGPVNIRQRIEALCEGLDLIERANKHEHFTMLTPDTYSCDWLGKRYLRIVRQGTNQRFVEMFIDSTNGDVYYPAGWAGPAKPHVRGNIASDNGLQTLFARKWLNHYGYLYLDSIKTTDVIMHEAQTKTLLSLLSPVWL